MAKVTKNENYRVEVYADWVGRNPSHKDYIDSYKEVLEAIQRHVDNISEVRVTWDTRETCEFCDSVWEDNPGCCEKAVDEWEKEHEA